MTLNKFGKAGKTTKAVKANPAALALEAGNLIGGAWLDAEIDRLDREEQRHIKEYARRVVLSIMGRRERPRR